MKIARLLPPPPPRPFCEYGNFPFFKKETNEDVIDFSNNLSAEPTDVCPFFEDIFNISIEFTSSKTRWRHVANNFISIT